MVEISPTLTWQEVIDNRKRAYCRFNRTYSYSSWAQIAPNTDFEVKSIKKRGEGRLHLTLRYQRTIVIHQVWVNMSDVAPEGDLVVFFRKEKGSVR